jgi:kinesin family protein 18/19
MKNINLPIITNFNSNNQNNIANRGKSLKTNPSDKRIISKMKRAVSNPKLNANNKSKNEETKSFIEEMKNGSFNILVCVRCRPLSSSEKQLSSYETIKIMDKMVILTDPIEYNGPTAIFKNRNKDQTYAFDYAFDKFTKQKTVFEKSTKFLIDGVVNGYNATVFAYGATGAGKTYTMLGTELNPGIMVLTLEELFDKVNSFYDRDYKLKFWLLEIYNENIRDLLKNNGKNNLENTNNEYLDLREDPEKGIVVSGITEISVTNSNEMLKILKRGNRNRTQEATGANETSSRSHAILQVSIEYKEKNSGIDFQIHFSKLSLIDLAGSERAAATNNKGIRLIEGANINRSLLTLGNCINALCEANLRGKKIHIPYRDSKLTRLLKDSLGGNARTVMIANVSPSINTFDDTYNTLKYANRAKNIKTSVTRNVLNAQYHISNYENIINTLKEENERLKNELLSKEENNNTLFHNNRFFGIGMNGLGNNFNNGKGGNNGNNIRTLFTDENKSQMDNSILSTINNENMNTIKFNNIKNEMKKYCDSQFEIKQKLISYQSEINKMRETQSNKFKNLQKNIETNQNKYREISATIERIFNTNSAKKELSEFQKDYLTLMMKNSSYRIQILDNKYNNMLNNTDIDQKNDYILELENQIKLRDELINENNIQTNNNIKTIETLRQQYTPRNPINLTGGFRRLLPPLSNQNKIINTNNNNDKINTSGMLFSNSSNQNPHINNMKNKFIKNNNKIGNNPYINSNNSNQKFKLINSNNIKPINLHINNNNLNTNNDFNSHRDKMNIKRDNSKKLFRYRGMSKENSHSFLLDNSNSNRNNSFLEKSPKVKRSDLKSAINDRNIRKQLSTNKIPFKGGKK